MSTTPMSYLLNVGNEFLVDHFEIIIDLLVRGENVTASNLLGEAMVRHPEANYMAACIQARVCLALGQSELAAKSEELAQQLGARSLPLAKRARSLGNSAFAANRMSLALNYYHIAVMGDPSDMRNFLNKSAIMLRTAEPRKAHLYALLALKMGLVFGAPQRLVDKARDRVKVGLQQTGAVLRRTNLHLLPDGFRLQWSTPAPDVTEIEAESEQLVREIELIVGCSTFIYPAKLYSEAAGHFSAAIALAPAVPGTYMDRAVCRLRMAEYAAGLADANRSIDLMGVTVAAKERARAFWLKGLCQFGLDNWREARRAFEVAGRLNPGNEMIAISRQKLSGRRNTASNVYFERLVQMAEVLPE